LPDRCKLLPQVGTAVRSLTVALDGSLVVAGNNTGTCYVWRMMRGTSLSTHFEPMHKLHAHQGELIRTIAHVPWLDNPWVDTNVTGRHGACGQMFLTYWTEGGGYVRFLEDPRSVEVVWQILLIDWTGGGGVSGGPEVCLAGVVEEPALLRARAGYVLKCLLSPDMRQLATASSDKTVKLWNIDGFKLDRTLAGHSRWVWDCVFSVDAAYLVSSALQKI
jgi:WD40 repeat protein